MRDEWIMFLSRERCRLSRRGDGDEKRGFPAPSGRTAVTHFFGPRLLYGRARNFRVVRNENLLTTAVWERQLLAFLVGSPDRHYKIRCQKRRQRVQHIYILYSYIRI